MRRFVFGLASAVVIAAVGLGISGCSSETSAGKMGTEKMSSTNGVRPMA